jgi:hypothetical protein
MECSNQVGFLLHWFRHGLLVWLYLVLTAFYLVLAIFCSEVERRCRRAQSRSRSISRSNQLTQKRKRWAPLCFTLLLRQLTNGVIFLMPSIHVQARKKKRIRAIKNTNRQQGYDSERNNKQAGWQQFTKKFSKKRPKGSMSAIHKNKSRSPIHPPIHPSIHPSSHPPINNDSSLVYRWRLSTLQLYTVLSLFSSRAPLFVSRSPLLGCSNCSIFESPATVDGKVGVVGSGNATTEFEVRKKYKFNIGGQ